MGALHTGPVAVPQTNPPCASPKAAQRSPFTETEEREPERWWRASEQWQPPSPPADDPTSGAGGPTGARQWLAAGEPGFGPGPAVTTARFEGVPVRQSEPSGPPGLVVQRRADGAADAVEPGVEERITASRGRGKPLSDQARGFFEPRLGADLGAVRVHDDSDADGLSRQLGARAFTVGPDIYFSSGQFDTRSSSGKRLLAHELTHVVQQGGAARTRLDKSPQRARPAIAQAPEGVQRLFGVDIEGLLDSVARNIPGYTLVTFILGRNPITGATVPRTAENLVGGLLGLVPGGGAIFAQLKQSGALTRAFTWISGQLGQLGITWAGIKQLISVAWDRVGVFNSLSTNIGIVKQVFAPTVNKLIGFGKTVLSAMPRFIFEGFLALVGAPVEKVMGFLRRAGNAIGTIFRDPVGFGKNLMTAVKSGFTLFRTNFVQHLKSALFGWLFGTLSAAGIQLPTSFDLKSIFGFILQILGLTYQDIRARIVKRLGPKGETIVAAMEKGFELVKLLVTQGPMALWEQLMQEAAALKDQLIGEVVAWVRNTIIVQALTKIASMLNPAGAIVQAVTAIYNVVMFFVNRWQQIKSLVDAIASSIMNIASGKVSQAAQWIEKSMAKGLTVMISFLARLIGLGGIAGKIKGVIDKLRSPIDKALDKAIDFLIKKGQAFLGAAKQGVKKGIQKLTEWWKAKLPFKTKDGKSHSLQFQGGPKDAKLVIIGSTQTVEQLLADAEAAKKKAEQAKPGKDKQDALVLLMQKHNQLVGAHTSLKNKMKKAGNAPKDAPVAVTEQDLEKIKVLVQPIKDLILDLQTGGELGVPTTQLQSGALRQGFGTRTVAFPLSLAGTPGSSPSDAGGFWDDLNLRRRGNGSYYIRGHLLSEKLHGPGTWPNMTPLTRAANKNHESVVESKVKGAVNALEPGQAVYYMVEAKYGRSKSSALDAEIDQREAKGAAALDVQRWRKIVAAEAHLPTGIRAEAYLVKQKSSDAFATAKPTGESAAQSNKFDKVKTIVSDITLPNQPEDSSLGQYELAGAAVQMELVSLDLSAPNADGKTLADALKQVPNVGQKTAERLGTLQPGDFASPETFKEAAKKADVGTAQINALLADSRVSVKGGGTQWKKAGE